MKTRRGWLASGLLAAVVVGGYLGLLPLLSSLATGPAWPGPIQPVGLVATVAAAPVTGASVEVGSGDPPAETPPPVDQSPDEAPSSESVNPQLVASTKVVARGGLARAVKPKKAKSPSGGSEASPAKDSTTTLVPQSSDSKPETKPVPAVSLPSDDLGVLAGPGDGGGSGDDGIGSGGIGG